MTRVEAIEQLEKAYEECVDLGETCGKDSVFGKRAEAIKAGLISLKVDEIADGYISKSVIENIKAEITESQNVVSETLKIDKEDCFYNGKWVGFELALAIIDKHIGKENE